MKTMKKVFAFFLMVTMVLAMASTAFAANITIDGGTTGSEYAAYKLLVANDLGDGKFAYTLNNTYADALKEVTGKTTGKDIIEYIAGLDTDGIRTFADDVYAEVKDMDPDYETTTDTFENVAQGYYLIVETKTGSAGDDGAEDTYSLVMLDTAGKDNVTIETKEDTPELEKKVQEKNDSTGSTSGWQDGADYDINDAVPFKLTGTVSEKYADYEKYYYAFHDEMSAGLTFNKDSVVVKVDGKVVDPKDYDVVTTGLTDDCTFEVIFDNLKTIVAEDGKTVTASSKITVEFTATLNGNAVIGKPGNPNEAKLEYSNNPYDEGEGKPETGETPEDKVIVFTYELIANKVDDEGEALEGAGFTLYKWVISDSAPSGAWVTVGDEITGTTTFTFSRLDAGQYKLVETTVPKGYNKAADIEFTIEATYDIDSADPKLTGLVIRNADGEVISDGEDAVFNIDVDNGSMTTEVVNKIGLELPSTGGMGTTIFYVVGGLLMAGAVVMLITKKKMSAHED